VNVVKDVKPGTVSAARRDIHIETIKTLYIKF